jgi:triacylglycerol lipase
MSNIYRKLVELIINGWSWFLDYIYVAYWQVFDFFIRTNPTKYTHPEQTGGNSEEKLPILLVPGIYENWQFMKPIAELLYRNGHSVHIVDGLGYNTGDVEKMASIVNEFLTNSQFENCIIVAHSKGGLIGKYLLANFNTHEKIKGMIALNTPFSGSRYAYFMPLRSTRIFIPNSPLLSLLASNTLVNNKIVSIFGIFDPHIPNGSSLEGAENIQLKTRGHFRIMNDSRVHTAILKGLKSLIR